MLKRRFRNGLVFLISFFAVFVSSVPFSYSRPPAKAQVKNVETADKQDKSKDEIEPIVPATNIITPLKPILVKPMRSPHRIKAATKPIVLEPIKLERPTMLSEPIRVTTLTKPEPVQTEATNLSETQSNKKNKF